MCDPEPEPALTATSEDQEIPDQPSTPPAEQDQDASGVGETSTNHKDPQTQQDPATVQASTIESTSPSLPVEDAVAEKALEAAPEQDATKPIEQTPEAPDQKNMSTENVCVRYLQLEDSYLQYIDTARKWIRQCLIKLSLLHDCGSKVTIESVWRFRLFRLCILLYHHSIAVR